MTHWRDYLELCKPKVVLLMLVTAIVGMFLATPGMVPWPRLILATVGIALAASAAAVVNHIFDRHIDAIMARTQRRPIVQGKVEPKQAIVFAIFIGILAMLVLWFGVNHLTALLSLLTLIGYAGVYTVYLKRATPQNIVIGGLAGAAPPLLGWTAVTGQLAPEALLLVLIIYTWTPPHFWALAIYRYEDYKNAEIPMLPVTHGIHFTKLSIVLYTILLVIVSVLPTIVGMSSGWYGLGALLLGARFLMWAIRLYRTDEARVAMQTFRYSIVYLFVLFILLLVDHYGVI
jgi:heme o synthase